MQETISQAFSRAEEQYAALGVDVRKALKILQQVSLSIHCWQGDDVGGFETAGGVLSGGGIQATGNYPGKARSIPELQADLAKLYTLLPGRHRLNLHAIYADFQGQRVERNEITPQHYETWLSWGGEQGIKLDFNATCFSHPLADAGFTLSSPNHDIRSFWIEHVGRCREIAAHFGRHQQSPSLHNLWIPDGCKDRTVKRMHYRSLLKESLDSVYAKKYPASELKDAVESKLFGIGSESFVAGSHEFYLAYALTNNLLYCLDLGHFHPTESVADKLSALLPFTPELLLHVSRNVRWDSDHVVILNDDILYLCQEIVRSRRMSSLYLALDFFDASLNRLGAWAIGSRSTLKGLLLALLEPIGRLEQYEEEERLFARLALLEEQKSLPWGAVWEYFCLENSCPPDSELIAAVEQYEKDILSKRELV